MKIKIILILFFYPFVSSAQISDTTLVKYNWRGMGEYKAELLVLKDFKESNNYYGEGLITTLRYQDSSYIIFHIGGLIQHPFFNPNKDTNINVTDSIKIDNGILRKGIRKDKELYWREESLQSGWINIGYGSVKVTKLKLFDKSIDSFAIMKK